MVAIPAPTPPGFVFKLTEEAAEKNFMILKRYDFDLAKAIHAQRSSPLGYGSEFRPPKTPMKYSNIILCGVEWSAYSLRDPSGH